MGREHNPSINDATHSDRSINTNDIRFAGSVKAHTGPSDRLQHHYVHVDFETLNSPRVNIDQLRSPMRSKIMFSQRGDLAANPDKIGTIFDRK